MKNNPLSDYNNRRKYWEYKDLRLQKNERMVLNTLKRFFRRQEKRILDQMPQQMKGLAEEAFNTEREKKLAKEATFPTLKRAMELEGQEVAERFGNDFVFTSEMDSWLNERTEMMADSITKTTQEQLSKTIQEGVEAGEDYDAFAKRISDKYSEIEVGRAEVIARTETHSTTQKANIEGYKQAQVETKTWVAVMDNRTRDEHAALDGEEQPIHKPFSNGEMFPSQPNCRCTI